MITFEEIKDKANRISDVVDNPEFLDVFNEEVVVQELAVRDIKAIDELVKVYKQVKKGDFTEEKGKEIQKVIHRKWKEDIC